MSNLSKNEKAFCQSYAESENPVDAYKANFKVGRMKAETIEKKAMVLLEQPTVIKQLESDAKDLALIDRYKKRRSCLEPRPKIKIESRDGKLVKFSHDHSTNTVFLAAAANAFGTEDHAFIDMMLRQVSKMIPSDEINMDVVNGIFSALAGIGPRDEIEAMLAAQMVAIHFASIEATRRAGISNQSFDARNMNLKHAGQLMRTYTQQMEALNRHRGKGQQKMTVEHVHVHEGGQAIVGTVNQGKGAGDQFKNEEQPHANRAINNAP